jgi:hypothetical protein
MKTYLLCLAALLITSLHAVQSQPCPVSVIVLSTQADIDAFAINYPNCQSYGLSLTISGEEITNLDGLSNLQTANHLTIEHAPNLTSLQGLNALTDVVLLAIDHTGIEHMHGLEQLNDVELFLVIANNPNLLDLNGLSGLKSVYGMYIDSNSALQNLDGLDSLETLDGIAITNNTVLSSVDGMPRLNHTDGDVYIGFNASLQHISGFDYLQRIERELTIEGNPLLTSVSGFPSLSLISKLKFIDNPSLTSLPSFPALTLVTSELIVRRNAALTTLDGLQALRRVNGYVRIDENQSLASLEGLNGLLVVNEALSITDNPSLTDLHALNSLNQIDALLKIDNNDALASLAGLDSIETIGSLEIRRNDLLSYCSVESICNHLYSGAPSLISENTGDCIIRVAVLDLCLVAADDPVAAQISVSPNPFSSTIYVNGIDATAGSYILYEGSGIQVAKGEFSGNRIDVHELSSGFYFMQLEMDGHTVFRSLIRM